MQKTGKTIATLVVGAAIGAAVGYILATDKEVREESLTKIKDKFADLKSKMRRKGADLEEEIFNA